MATRNRSRRDFIRLAAGTTVLAGSTPLLGGARELTAPRAQGGAGAGAPRMTGFRSR